MSDEIPRHCDAEALRERDRWVCPVCRSWKWVQPRDEQNRWRMPTAKPVAHCPECGFAGRKIDKYGAGYRRYEDAAGHRWSVGVTRAYTPRRRQFDFRALVMAMGVKR